MTTLLIVPESPLNGGYPDLVACVADDDEPALAAARARYELQLGHPLVDYEIIPDLVLTNDPAPKDQIIVSRHHGIYRCAEYPYDTRGQRYLFAVRRPK